MATTLYAELENAALSTLTLPTGAFGTYTLVEATKVGANAKYLAQLEPSNALGTLQQSQAAASQTSSTTQRTYCYGQFASDPLTAQGTIAAGSWAVGLAVSATGGGSHTILSGWVGIYLVNGATGAARTTIVSGPIQVGANHTTGTLSEHTCYSTTVSGAAFTPTAGDYLVAELAVGWKESTGSTTAAPIGYASGYGIINADNAATTNAESFVACPTTLAFSVPWAIVAQSPTDFAPGLCQYSKFFYGANTGKYWAFFYPNSTTMQAWYSSDLATWSAPTNQTLTQAHNNSLFGHAFALASKSIASTDVAHFNFWYSGDYVTHLRATFAGTTVTWGSEVQTDTSATTSGTTQGGATAIASDNSIWDQDPNFAGGGLGINPVKATNVDAGTSWTTGFGTPTNLFSNTNPSISQVFLPLSSGGQVLLLGDNGGGFKSCTNIEWSLWNGSAWSPATATDVFSTTATIGPDDWGACLRTDTDAHCVRRNDATSTFTHMRWNGTSWSAGDSIPNHTCRGGGTLDYTAGGTPLVTDGTNVWLFIMDSATGNQVFYSKWTSGTGWGAWTLFEASCQWRSWLTAHMDAANRKILVAWQQLPGGNTALIVEPLSVPAAAIVQPPRPIVVRYAVQRASVF